MISDALFFVNLVLAGVLLGKEVTTFFAIVPAARTLPVPTQVAFQQAIGPRFRNMGPPIFNLTLLTGIALAATVDAPGRYFAIAGSVCILAMLVVVFRVSVPINIWRFVSCSTRRLWRASCSRCSPSSDRHPSEACSKIGWSREERAMSTNAETHAESAAVAQQGGDGSKGRVVFVLQLKPGMQEAFLKAYESIRYEVAQGVPGHLVDQVCQAPDDPDRWLITSEWRQLDDFLAWEATQEHRDLAKPLRDCFADAKSFKYVVREETRAGSAVQGQV
jgi:heme-degrading monooxygenase HmoA